MMPNSLSQTELSIRLVLWRTPGVGPISMHKLIQAFGSTEIALQASVQSLQSAGLRQAMIEALKNPNTEAQRGAERDQAWLAESTSHTILTPEHEHYPRLLLDLDTAPPLLFVWGRTSILNDPQIAIIGSRNPSKEGRGHARAFASYLAQHGLGITSGLAEGVDAESHQSTLEVEGTTLAVVATGLDIVYPSKHRHLAERIAEKGAILSEYPLGVTPHPQNFPRRNRIISGMSVGTLVVEATLKSGSLVTAKHAMEQGREVFAIPGSIHNPMVRGCHQLIRQGAKLVETAQDILEEVAPQLLNYLSDQARIIHTNPTSAEPTPQATTYASSLDWALDAEHQLILNTLTMQPLPIDQIIIQTGLTADVVSSILLILELQGYAVACGGGYYKKCQTPRD